MERYRLDLSFVSSLLVIVAVAVAVVLTDLVSAASQPLGWALAASIVALLLSPIVTLFDRRLPHVLAVILGLVLVAVLLGGTWIGVGATVADNVDDLRDDAPAAARELEDDYQLAADFELERRVSEFVEELDDRLGTQAQLQRGAGTASTYVVTGTLMLFLLIYGPRFVSGGLAQVDDPTRRARANAVIDLTVRHGRGYLLAALAQALVVTLVSWLVFAALGLDASFVLGLLVGGSSLVPYIGIVLGGLPALLLAAGLEGWPQAIPVLVLLLALQLIDVLVVRPRVDPRTVHVGPALPMIVGLIGWEIYGLGGAVYSIAVLVLLLALGDAVSTDDDGTDVADVSRPAS